MWLTYSNLVKKQLVKITQRKLTLELMILFSFDLLYTERNKNAYNNDPRKVQCKTSLKREKKWTMQ